MTGVGSLGNILMHCVKSVHIWNYSGIFPFLEQNNFEHGHFLRNDGSMDPIGKGELFHIHFLCCNCNCNTHAAFTWHCKWEVCFGYYVSHCNNVMCNVHFKSASPTCLCRHHPPNITQSAIYPLKGVTFSLIYIEACVFNLLSKRIVMIFTFIIINPKIA